MAGQVMCSNVVGMGLCFGDCRKEGWKTWKWAIGNVEGIVGR